MTQSTECLFSGYDSNSPSPESLLAIPAEASDEELLEGIKGEVCPREDCRLLGATLLEYLCGDSSVRPVSAITQQVPEDCAWSRLPHTEERITALLSQEPTE